MEVKHTMEEQHADQIDQQSNNTDDKHVLRFLDLFRRYETGDLNANLQIWKMTSEHRPTQ